jgi:hypothetical protein
MPDLRVSFPKPCGEKWEAMTVEGRARICARCDKAVHDLSHFSLDEAEALLRRNPDTCVRARIGGDGAVTLKPGRRGDARRMVIAAAATAGLLAVGAPAFAKKDRPAGAIAGDVETDGFPMRVKATGTNGRIFRSKVKKNGKFTIRHLPSGTYSLTFVPTCGENMTIENVVVGAGETIVPKVQNPNQCIFIGLLRIEDARG